MARMIKGAPFALLSLAVALGACNTIEGAGRDVSAAGRGVSDTASDVQERNDDDDRMDQGGY